MSGRDDGGVYCVGVSAGSVSQRVAVN